MKKIDIAQEIRLFIRENFLYGKENAKDDQHLFDSGIIDSFGFTELMSFIEKVFSVNFKRSEVKMENFDTINHIIESVKKKIGRD